MLKTTRSVSRAFRFPQDHAGPPGITLGSIDSEPDVTILNPERQIFRWF